MSPQIIGTINVIANIILLVILARIILGFFPSRGGVIGQFVFDVTEPLLKPFRFANPKNSPIDFSPIFLFLFIQAMTWVLSSL